MPHPIRARVGRKLLLAVGLPTLAVALSGVVWLRAVTRDVAPGLWGGALAFVAAMAAATTLIHLAAVHLLVEAPLRRMLDALRRTAAGDFLLRMPVESEDELGRLARGFNAALAANTDLRARRLEDAQSMESMQRELSLKAQVEQQALQLDAANRGLETRLRELTLLSELARTMTSTLRLDELLHAITARVGSALGYEAFAVLLLDEPARELVVASSAGVHAHAAGSRLGLDRSIAGAAAERRALVLVKDTRDDPLFPAGFWSTGQHGSLLAVPMVARDACVGVLDFFRPAPDAFAEDEIRFLESLAGQAGLAISNARLHERTLELSLTDALTGLPNRRAFVQRAERELERARRFGNRFAVAMVDVDRFGELNDASGRLAADAALRAVGEALAGAVREVDTVARHGGEEFALLLPRADGGAAMAQAERLRAAVAAAPAPRAVTVSIGVASFPDDASDLPTLLDCADAALFAAKKEGRDRAVAYAPGMRDRAGRKRDVRTTGAV